MRVTVESGSIEQIEADAIVVNLFKGVTSPSGATGAVDSLMQGEIGDVIGAGDFSGERGDVLVLYTREKLNAPRVIVAGLGEREKFGLDEIRRASASAAVRARKLGVKRLATIVHGAGIGGVDAAAAAQATVEGALLGLYEFKEYKSSSAGDQNGGGDKAIDEIVVVEHDEAKLGAVQEGVAAGEAVAAGVTLGRNLVNHPPNKATPAYLAEVAEDIGRRHDMRVEVWDRARIVAEGMGGLAAVGAGSEVEPRFIVIDYRPAGTDDQAPYVLVGKAITFDTGGISIKPSLGMEKMKYDMGGGAAVLGAMEAVGRLKLPFRVLGLVASAENMPGGRATRPGDVITALNGKTIEILNTDAEGRLVLADALSYAAKLEPKPKAVVDIATLTGAIMIALGGGAAGLFANDDELSDQLVGAGDDSGEHVWRMPLWESYGDAVKSDVADIKNVLGKSPGAAGAVFAAKFLEHFVDYPWAHLDIAGVGWDAENVPHVPKGGTGFGVRLFVEWLRAR